MKNRVHLLVVVAAAMLAGAGSSSQAAPADFSFSASVTPPNVNPPGTSGTLTMAGLPSGGLLNASGSGTDIVFGEIFVTSSSMDDQDIGSQAYSFTLTITDLSTGVPITGSVAITGILSGTLRNNAADISNLYTMPTLQTIILGNFTYTVDFGNPPGGGGSYTAPSPFRSGSFGAHVRATPTAVPEPASVSLLGMGLVSLVGLYSRRKLRA